MAGRLSETHVVAMPLPRCPPAGMAGGPGGGHRGPCFCICLCHLWLLPLRVCPGNWGNWEALRWLFQVSRRSHGWERWGRQRGGSPGQGAARQARVRSPLLALGFLQTPAEVVYPHILEVQQLLQPPHLQLQDLSRDPDTPSTWFWGAGGTSIHPRQASGGAGACLTASSEDGGGRGDRELRAGLMWLLGSLSSISHL